MKNFFRHLAVGIAAALLLFAVAAVAAACTEGGEQTQLSFTQASVTVGAGESVTAQVETDAEGQVAFPRVIRPSPPQRRRLKRASESRASRQGALPSRRRSAVRARR